MRRFRDYFAAHREQLDALIFDIDGTLTSGRSPIPEAVEFIAQLQKDDFPYFLLTNDSSHSCGEKAAIVCKCGINVSAGQIISAGDALAEYIRNNALAGHKFYQCGNLGEPNFAQCGGLCITRDPAEIDSCEGVIMGEGVYDWQREINGMFNLLLRHPEYPVLVANPDSYWSYSRGMGIGAGGIARMVCSLVQEAGFEMKLTYVGKPYPPVYEYVKKHLSRMLPGCQNPQMERIAMIGDSLASDIQGANYAGMTSCLVLTGVTSRELAVSAPLHRKPDEIFDTL